MAHGPVGSPYARNAPSKTTPPKQPGRSALHKQAVVYAAEQNLKPWEVQKPPKQPAPVPFKAAPARQAPLRTRYKAALGAPVNAPIKVGGKTVPARQYLADTMTPKRREEYHQSLVPPPPKPKGGLLNAIEQTPGSIAHNLLGYGKTAAKVSEYGGKQASGQGTYTDRPLSQSLQLPAKAALGNSLYNALTQGQTSHLGAAGLEAATIFPFFRAGRIAAEAAKAAKVGEEAKVAAEVARPAAETARYSLRPLEPGGHYFNQEGDKFNASIAEISKPYDHLEHVNLHDSKGKVVGTIAYDARPGRSKIYVESIYIDPAHRGSTEALQALTRPLLADGRPIDATFRNEKLGRLFTRMVERGRAQQAVAGKAVVPEIARAQPERVTETGVVLPRGVRSVQPPPVPEPLTAAQGGTEVMKGMGQATRIRREQTALRAQEHAVRTAEYERLIAANPSEEGRRIAMAALSGPMPTLRFDRFTEMNPQTFEAMIHHIRSFPDLQGLDKTYTRINTEQALRGIVAGQLPRKFEQKLLRNVFGDQTTSDLMRSVGFWKRWGQRGLNLLGVPRTLLASFDLSAPLRQGLLFGVSHPILWGRNFPAMIKAFGSPGVYDRVMEDITSRPTFDLMQQAGVPFTDIGQQITGREEQFMSSYAERIPGIGHMVRGSNRAYVTFLNKARSDYFDWLVQETHKVRPELDLESPEGQKVLKDYARVVGNATGRGTVKNQTLAKALPLLNQTLFAPRLLKSRFDVIANPHFYLTLDPLARREAFKQLAGLVGTVGGVLALAKLAGAHVNQDPRNADWAKIRVGNTRFDIAAGFQQPLRLIAQISPSRFGGGEIVSSTTGKKLNLGAGGGYGHLTRLDILSRFGETKLAPPPSLAVDFFRGSDFTGKPFAWKSAMYQRLTPLLAQDAIDLYRQGDTTAGSIAAATALYGIGLWGVGAQTYGAKPKTGTGTAKPRDYLGSGSTQTSDYARSSGSTSSDYLRSTP